MKAYVNSVEQSNDNCHSHKISGTDAQKSLLPQKKCELLAASIDSFRPVMLGTLLTYHDQVVNLVNGVRALLVISCGYPEGRRQFCGKVMHYGPQKKHDACLNQLPWGACFSLPRHTLPSRVSKEQIRNSTSLDDQSGTKAQNTL